MNEQKLRARKQNSKHNSDLGPVVNGVNPEQVVRDR